MTINLFAFIVGVVAGYAISTFSVTIGLVKFAMTKKSNEMEYMPLKDLQDWGKTINVSNIASTANESGEVVMPDRADVIKRDDLKIDDLLQ